MEKEHVYEVYEKIAPHFSNTRYKPWPKVEEFMNNVPPGSIVADIGCGNGKYMGCNA
jgi:ubiquinone/menaquinone biosynthesis C-methylase UbiE